LAIDDWNQLVQIPGVDELSDINVPEWQMELGKRELQHLVDGTTQLMEWEEAKRQFTL
jgi:hypothetical protein